MDGVIGGPFERVFLDDAESLALFRHVALARVVISIHCLPAALPVFVHLAARHVLIASVEAAVVDAAHRSDVLTVQVDGAEEDGSVWSVHVTGVAHVPEASDAVSTIAMAPAMSRALVGGAQLVAVPITVVAGERIRWGIDTTSR